MAIFGKTPAMICDGLRCFSKLKIAGKWSISSQRVAGPIHPEQLRATQPRPDYRGAAPGQWTVTDYHSL